MNYFDEHTIFNYIINPIGVQLGQWWHEARVDWLELNESGQLLLLRDTRRRLALLQLHTGDKVRFIFNLIYLTQDLKWLDCDVLRVAFRSITRRLFAFRRGATYWC